MADQHLDIKLLITIEKWLTKFEKCPTKIEGAWTFV